MSKPLVVVFTGNSNTGSATIDRLLTEYSDKVRIRAVVRSAAAKEEVEQAVQAYEGADVEVIVGDIAKKQILGPCFAGAKAAYFATPTSKDRAKLVKYFVDACMDHGVEFGVIISYIGSETKATNYHTQFSEMEEYAASKAGQPVTLPIADRGQKKFSPIIVRTCPFYQNFYGCLSAIKEGTLYYPLGDAKLTHVDYSDVGKVIALILADPESHGGNTYNIIGESQAGNMIASNIAMKANFECQYETVSDDIAIQAFVGLGLQEWIAVGNVEMLKFIREGGMTKYGAGDFEALTGEKPMRFGAFVKDFLRPMLRD